MRKITKLGKLFPVFLAIGIAVTLFVIIKWPPQTAFAKMWVAVILVLQGFSVLFHIFSKD